MTELLAGLRCAALEMVGYGWPVLRGTYFDGTRWRGYPGAVDLRPVDKDWPSAWTLTPSQVTEWWTEYPYSVLLGCGHGVDCVELPASAAPRALRALRSADVSPPAMLTPVGALVLFVRTARVPHCRVLASATLHSVGSWVVVPPAGESRDDAEHRWVPGAAPSDVSWRLPELPLVHEIIAAAASGTFTAPDMAVRPRRPLCTETVQGQVRWVAGEVGP